MRKEFWFQGYIFCQNLPHWVPTALRMKWWCINFCHCTVGYENQVRSDFRELATVLFLALGENRFLFPLLSDWLMVALHIESLGRIYYLIDQLTLSLRSSNSKVDVWFIVFSTVTPLQFWVSLANGGPTLIWTCFTTHNNLVLQKFFPSRGFSHRHCLYVWVFPSLFLPYLQAWDIAYSIQSCNDYGPPLFSCPLFPEAIITPVGQTQIRVFEGTGKWFCLNLTSLRGFTPSHLP